MAELHQAATYTSHSSNMNDFFKKMSTPNEEEIKWMHYTDKLSSICEVISKFCQQILKFPIAVKVYGSSAERLKCYLPEDIGDIDMMVYPVNPGTKVEDDMIEYCESVPGFVRLRGANHPIYKQCLLDNSPYIASASVKIFHPAIYGDAASCLVILPDIVRESGQIYASSGLATDVKQKPHGPAMQLDFAQSFPTLTEQVEDLRNYRDFRMTNESRSCFEVLAASASHSMGNQYTPEHAHIFESYIRNVEEELRKLSMNPSVETYFKTMNDIMLGDRARQLGAQVQELNARLRSQESNPPSPAAEERDISALNVDNDETESTAESATEIPNETCQESKRTDLPSTGCKAEVATTREDTESKDKYDTDSKVVVAMKSEATPSTSLIDRVSSTPEASHDDKVQQFRSLLMAIFGTKTPSTPDVERAQYEDKAQRATRQGGMDLVPALRANGWPQIATSWITRDRKWPRPEVIQNIIDHGFHIVVKSPGGDAQSDADFRLSFSHAEYLLSRELTEIQRECYRCVKLFHKRVLKHREPKILTTYLLKTLLFWAVEESDVESWDEDSRGACVIELLDNLQTALESRYLPHYFIPECNLFDSALREFPDQFAIIAAEVKSFKENPLKCPVFFTEDQRKDAQQSVCTPDKPEESMHSCNEVTESVSEEQKTVSQFPRYHDLKALYHEICHEMIAMATSDDVTTFDDEVTKSVVAGLRNMSQTRNLTADELMTILESGFENIYTVSVVQGSADPRRRLLMTLQWTVQALSLACQQPDLEEGNEEAIAARMWRAFPLPTIEGGGASDFLNRLMNSCEPQMTSQGPAIPDDDIPLD